MANEGNIIGPKQKIDSIQDSVENIEDSLMTLTETGGTLTTDGTEQDIYLNNAPAALYVPKRVFVDFTNQQAGETVVIRTYYRIKSSDGLIKNTEATYAGVQDPLLIDIALKENRYGVQITAEKTGGVNRDYVWEVVYEI